jgi:hypothetical protein
MIRMSKLPLEGIQHDSSYVFAGPMQPRLGDLRAEVIRSKAHRGPTIRGGRFQDIAR